LTSERIEDRSDLQVWLKRVEQLRHAPEWAASELPVEMKQTHISVLLLGRQHVIKLKKPVDFGFLDYTTLEKRRQACEAEVRLNRRLCPDTYLGVREVIEVEGQPRFSGSNGKIVDYGVWMNRLPEERMLDQLVKRDEANEAMLDRIADRLSEFHYSARRGPEVERWGSVAEVRHNWDENFSQTADFVGRTISAPAYEAIRSWVIEWVETNAKLLDLRVSAGRIVDGHGDVRCESICVKDDVICIYDCIEFNDRFRCDDVASEVAFLAMDLDARGRPDLGYFFTESYQQRTSDGELFRLLPFYRCYRAYVRGKVLSFRLNESEFSAEERGVAAERASRYFDMARRYAARLKQPTVVAIGGLSGTGKTSMARAIAAELGWHVIAADAVRQTLFGAAKQPASYGEGVYTAEANLLTYQKMIDEGRALLREGDGVILDATFRYATERDAARRMAQEAGAEWRLIECRLAPERVRARLIKRAVRQEGFSDASWDTYLRQRATYEPLCSEKDSECLVLETSGSLLDGARTASDWLRLRDGSATG
jgi:uncharacterized protein